MLVLKEKTVHFVTCYTGGHPLPFPSQGVWFGLKYSERQGQGKQEAVDFLSPLPSLTGPPVMLLPQPVVLPHSWSLLNSAAPTGAAPPPREVKPPVVTTSLL